MISSNKDNSQIIFNPILLKQLLNSFKEIVIRKPK
jgi:hypothetical protein